MLIGATNWTAVAAITSGAAALGTLILAGVTVWLGSSTRKMSRQTGELADETRRLADSTSRSVDLAEQELEVLSEQARATSAQVARFARRPGATGSGHATEDRSRLVVNSYLTLSGIPESAYEYRLGSRSALELVVERFSTQVDGPSGIANDPNDYRPEDGRYVVDLLRKVVTVAMETQRLIGELPVYELRPT
jgi:hypothetical protein